MENDINDSSKTDFVRFDAMTDDMIDTSEIPPLTDEFFEEATWRMPDPEVASTIEDETAYLLSSEAMKEWLLAARSSNISIPVAEVRKRVGM